MIRRILLSIILFNLFVCKLTAGDYVPYPVIFVHGLGSSDAKAWTTTKNNLKQYYSYSQYGYLSEEKFFPTFDYESKNNGDITDIAKDLAVTLDYTINNNFPSGYTGEKKVILVCHSMGGLVARALLKEPGEYANKIAKIIYIGTPHKGSPFASCMYLLNKEIDKIRDDIRNDGVNPKGALINAEEEAIAANNEIKYNALKDIEETLTGRII